MKKIDDKIMLGVLVYVFLVATVGGFLPEELFFSSIGSDRIDDGSLRTSYNSSYETTLNPIKQVSWFKKVLTVLFVPFIIEGIPLFLGLLITFLNYVSALIGGIYVYDKVRGIGS